MAYKRHRKNKTKKRVGKRQRVEQSGLLRLRKRERKKGQPKMTVEMMNG